MASRKRLILTNLFVCSKRILGPSTSSHIEGLYGWGCSGVFYERCCRTLLPLAPRKLWHFLTPLPCPSGDLPTKTWTSMVYPWDVNFGIWYILFYIHWMYGEHPIYLPLDVLWGISKVRPKFSVVRIIIPININNLGLHHLYFFLYFSLLFPF
jgi:hypothetical protein